MVSNNLKIFLKKKLSQLEKIDECFFKFNFLNILAELNVDVVIKI
jgi:hypothetical protein